MRCPACSMETPEEHGYCDFCKEPFRKKAPPPERPKAPEVKVPPEVMARLLEARRPPPPPDPKDAELPAEFAHLDAGDRIPEVPEVAKKLAWGFLGLVAFWALVGTLWFVRKASREARAALPPPVPGGAAVEGVPPPPPPPPPPPGAPPSAPEAAPSF